MTEGVSIVAGSTGRTFCGCNARSKRWETRSRATVAEALATHKLCPRCQTKVKHMLVEMGAPVAVEASHAIS